MIRSGSTDVADAPWYTLDFSADTCASPRCGKSFKGQERNAGQAVVTQGLRGWNRGTSDFADFLHRFEARLLYPGYVLQS
mmetsp:Transcript_29758/g.79076  ORF Transcript_29758/g.79076 Transcript_29758/m.79076 type:complete len:80 (-) Transcript_29758:3-242(-)